MNKSFIKKDFSKEDIIKLVLSLGSDSYKNGNNGELIFQTICHNESNGSYKLYYYHDSQIFHCYTDCGDNFDVYDLICRVKQCNFYDSLTYVNKLLGLEQKQRIGFQSEHKLIDDWEMINKYTAVKKSYVERHHKILPSDLVDYYFPIVPVEWEIEGITRKTIEKYQIRYDLTNNKIIIPYFNLEGQLIGLRGRALNDDDVKSGRKYMPVTLEGSTLKHSTAFCLYGLNVNQSAIKSAKKIMLFEAEKSVLKCEEFYGNNNFTVACCGSNISTYQRDLILRLGVKEVFLAFDKEYHQAFSRESDSYSEKILSLAYKFCPYVTTYVLWDTDNLLNYKDAPCDQGKSILEQLMKTKYEVLTQEE